MGSAHTRGMSVSCLLVREDIPLALVYCSKSMKLLVPKPGSASSDPGLTGDVSESVVSMAHWSDIPRVLEKYLARWIRSRQPSDVIVGVSERQVFSEAGLKRLFRPIS